MKPALESAAKKKNGPLPELTGEALDYVQKREKSDEEYQRKLESIDERLEIIESSGKDQREKRKAIAVLQKELNKLETARAKETLESLFGEPQENTTFNLQFQNRDYAGKKRPTETQRREVKEVVEDAVRYVQPFLDEFGIKFNTDLEVFTESKSNASSGHKPGVININTTSKGTIDGVFTLNPFTSTVHEIVHDVVAKNQKLRTALQDFVNKHTVASEKWNNSDNAWYGKLDIPMPSYYCTFMKNPQNGDDYPEEFLTMFFTCLCSDTSLRYDMDDMIRTGTDFARKYPAYFNGIMDILKGLK